MKKRFVLVSVMFLLISASLKVTTETNPKKIKKIIEFFFLPNEYMSINIFEFHYTENQIDSVIYNTRKLEEKFNLKYKKTKNISEVFSYFPLKDTTFKKYQYEYDSLGRILKFQKYENNKVIKKDSFIYNNSSKLLKKFSASYFLWYDSAKHYIEDFYVTEKGNIDSSKQYFILNDTTQILILKSYFKFDDKINPFNRMAFQDISNDYFNANNMIDEYTINQTADIMDSAFYKFEYGEDNYPVRKRYRNYQISKKPITYKFVY